jgi:hypothetical protein
MQYFSCSSGPGAGSIKNTLGHVTLNLCFLHPVVSVGHVVHSDASGARICNARVGLVWIQQKTRQNTLR